MKVLLQNCTSICVPRKIVPNEFGNNGNFTQIDINANCRDFW